MRNDIYGAYSDFDVVHSRVLEWLDLVITVIPTWNGAIGLPLRAPNSPKRPPKQDAEGEEGRKRGSESYSDAH